MVIFALIKEKQHGGKWVDLNCKKSRSNLTNKNEKFVHKTEKEERGNGKNLED